MEKEARSLQLSIECLTFLGWRTNSASALHVGSEWLAKRPLASSFQSPPPSPLPLIVFASELSSAMKRRLLDLELRVALAAWLGENERREDRDREDITPRHCRSLVQPCPPLPPPPPPPLPCGYEKVFPAPPRPRAEELTHGMARPLSLSVRACAVGGWRGRPSGEAENSGQ